MRASLEVAASFCESVSDGDNYTEEQCHELAATLFEQVNELANLE